MARYADGLIADGEHILLRTRQHWFSIVAYTIAFWVLVAISVGFFLLGRVTNWEIFNWITLVSFVGALVWIAWRYASWSFQDYIVTNRRVMQVEGIINKVSSDSSLEKINDAVLKQGLFGRLLHFGDLDILTASETTVDQFRMLNDAAELQEDDAQRQVRPRARGLGADAQSAAARRARGDARRGRPSLRDVGPGRRRRPGDDLCAGHRHPAPAGRPARPRGDQRGRATRPRRRSSWGDSRRQPGTVADGTIAPSQLPFTRYPRRQ